MKDEKGVALYKSLSLTIQTNDKTLSGQKTVIVFENTLVNYPTAKAQFNITLQFAGGTPAELQKLLKPQFKSVGDTERSPLKIELSSKGLTTVVDLGEV